MSTQAPGAPAARRLLRDRTGGNRVTNIELFFDLVYVFAVTQLSHYLVAASHRAQRPPVRRCCWRWSGWPGPTPRGSPTGWTRNASRSACCCVVADAASAWRCRRRCRGAFDDPGAGWSAARTPSAGGPQRVHGGRAARPAAAQLRAHPRLVHWSAARWPSPAGSRPAASAGTAVGCPPSASTWPAVSSGSHPGPRPVAAPRDWTIEGGHFAERCQGFILIALGESIVIIGATLSGDWRTSPAPTIAAFVVSFAGSVALWWLYFDRRPARARESSHPQTTRAGSPAPPTTCSTRSWWPASSSPRPRR